MRKDGVVYVSKYPATPPEWYWTAGLHDACVKRIEPFDFPVDYNRFVGDKNKKNRNALVLDIGASQAIGDSSVEKICFYNYEITSPELSSVICKKNLCWLADRLEKQEDKFLLEIDFHDCEEYPEYFTLKIIFERAEVKRL